MATTALRISGAPSTHLPPTLDCQETSSFRNRANPRAFLPMRAHKDATPRCSLSPPTPSTEHFSSSLRRIPSRRFAPRYFLSPRRAR